MLGRDALLKTCNIFLDVAVLGYFNVTIEKIEDTENKISCIVIKGETQQGKTRFLEEIYHENLKDNLNCIIIELHANQSMVSKFCLIFMINIY